MQNFDHLSDHLEAVEDGWWRSTLQDDPGGYDPLQPDFITYTQRSRKSFWERYREQVLLETLQSFPPADNIIFDVGGGYGALSQVFHNAGLQSVLVEPDPGFIQAARMAGVPDIIQAALSPEVFKPGCMMNIGIFDVIEHIHAEGDFLQALSHCLASGGYLYITVPAFPLLFSAKDRFLGHYRRYTIPVLRKKLAAQGFQTIFASYFFSSLFFPILLMKALPYRLGLCGRNEHQSLVETLDWVDNNRLLQSLLNGYAKVELNTFKRGPIPIGTSCIMVARKVSSP